MVLKPKQPGGVWLCVEANKAIAQERHLMPTLDEVVHDLNGAKVFSKLDLNQGYHQLAGPAPRLKAYHHLLHSSWSVQVQAP